MKTLIRMVQEKQNASQLSIKVQANFTPVFSYMLFIQISSYYQLNCKLRCSDWVSGDMFDQSWIFWIFKIMSIETE